MFKDNLDNVLSQISACDRVLDIDVWAIPFNRADYVLDIQSYEMRGMFVSQGRECEHFSKDTWIMRDSCDRTSIPFINNFFDYVIYSYTFEDIRDRVFVCSEIDRFGKRGYFEISSLQSQLLMGAENHHHTGYSQHRWLVDIRGEEIWFAFNYHHMHSHWEFHLPKRHPLLRAAEQVQIFCEDKLKFRELVMVKREEVASFMIGNLKRYGRGHSSLRQTYERSLASVKGL